MGVPETSKRGSSFGAVKSRGLPPSDPLLRQGYVLHWGCVQDVMKLVQKCLEGGGGAA